MSGALTTCKEVLTNISNYLDGELDRTACDAIERHCLDCPSCAAVVNGLRETVGLCRQAAAVPLPDGVRERARDSVRQLLDRHEKES
jgi:anti-sigma factor RsiW